VVGIVDFKLNPYVRTLDTLISEFDSARQIGNVKLIGIDQNKISKLYARAIKSMSLGVGGCVSTDYLKRLADSK
jgi:hypothetical protein